MGVRFHPTDAELINLLKRCFKGEIFFREGSPIHIADIYGDQPPWEIFGADSEEKVRYFITRLKKRKSEYTRFARTCAKGTWKAQTGENSIKNNHNGIVVGFKRSFTFVTKEPGQNKTWLMKEYSVAHDFFRENNHIPKENFVICRIKKKTNKEKVNAVEIQDCDVAGIINHMLFTPNHNNYCTKEDQDEWDSIIDTVCDTNCSS